MRLSLPKSPQLSAWRRRIRHSIGHTRSRSHFLVGLLLAALGFALVAQVTRDQSQELSGLRQNELVQVLSDLTERRDRLATERSQLEAEQRSLASGTSGSESAILAAQKRLDALGVLAGTVPAEGPGLEIVITERGGRFTAAQLLGLVQELREAGAEAIQVGASRVVASTAFTDADNKVVVDGIPQRSPLRILAIGEGQTLSTALHIPGGVLESLSPQVQGQDTVKTMVQITALRPVPRPQFARPVSEPPTADR